MLKINLILDILRDGKFHRVTDLKIEINVNDLEMQKILSFLHKFDLVEIVDNKQIRTKQSFRRLITQSLI